MLHTIKNYKKIAFEYKKFWKESATKRNVEPLALKEFKSSLHLIANDLKDNLFKTFGLDRLNDLFMELLSQGNSLTVLEPAMLVEELEHAKC